MADEEPAALPNVAMKEFADWADEWRSGNKHAPTKIVEVVSEPESESLPAAINSAKKRIVDLADETNRIAIHPVSIDIVSSAPIDTVIEMQMLYHIEKNVIANLIGEWAEKGKIPHQLATWMKEARTTLAEVHKMTDGFQDKVALKKMDLAIATISSNTELRDDFKIRMIKELEQAEMLANVSTEAKT